MSVSTAYRSSFTNSGTLPTSSGSGPIPPIYCEAGPAPVVTGGQLVVTGAAGGAWTVVVAPRTESLADGERHYIKVSGRQNNDIYFGLLDASSLGPVWHYYGGTGGGVVHCGVWNGSGFVGQGFMADFNEGLHPFVAIRRTGSNYFIEYAEDDGTGAPAAWQNAFQVTPDGAFTPGTVGFLLVVSAVGSEDKTSTFDAMNTTATEAAGGTLKETAATGDFHAGATWVGGVAPLAGDRIKINTGHTVTVRYASSPIITLGTNVAGNLAIEGVGTGKLVIEDGVRLNLQGHVQQPNATWQIGAGCLIEATNVGWEWRMGTANFQTDCILKVNGLRSNPTTFRTIAGGTKLRFDVLGGFLGSAQFQFTGVKLESIGLLTSSSWDVGFPYLTYFRDVTFDGNCAGYTVATGLYGGSSKVELTRTSFKSGASNPTFYVVNSHSGARVDLDTVIFDGAAPTFVSVPVSFTRVYLRTVPTWSSTTTALAWEDVVIEKVAEAEMYFPINPAARFGPTYWLATLGSGYNYHFVSPNAGSDVRTWTIRNWIFDTGRYTSGDADGITNPIGGVGSILDVEGCIVLAGPSANTTLVTMAGSSDGVKLRGRRNTYFCNGFGQSAMQFAEASNGVAGQIDEWRSNLAWGTSSDKAFHMWAYAPTPPSTAVAGIVNSTLVTHNAHWNPLLAGVYALSGPSAGNMPSGTNDRVLTANPFLDSTRDAAKWAYTLGLAETPAAAIDAIKKINDFTGQVPGATFRALFDYVTAGFQPVGTAASTLRTAGHDGSYIGAVEPAAGAGEAPSITLSQTTASRTIVQGASSFTPVSINITNGGTGTLDGLSVGESGDAGGGAKGVLGSTTGPTTLTVDQDSGLAALVPGTYTITYTVSSTAAGLTGGSKSFVLTLIVQTAPTGGSGPKTYSGRVKNSVGSVIPGIPFAIVSNSNPTVVTASLANSVDVTFTPLAVGTATVVVQAGGLQRSYAVTVTAA